MAILTTSDLYEATVRDYTRQAQRMGLPAEPEAIRRQAMSDLQLVANYQAQHPPIKRSPMDPTPRKTERRADELDRAVAELGGKAPRGRRLRDRVLHGRGKDLPWWWGHARARIKRILQGAQGTSLIAALGDAEVPVLAMEFARHWTAMIQRRPWAEATSGRPYDGLDDDAAGRKFERFVEDLCDRSRATLGVWRHL